MIQKSSKDQGLLIYSKDCFGCHVLGQKYEETARKCLSNDGL